MKLNAVLAAALTLGFALTSHAATVNVTTDAMANSTVGGVGKDVGLFLTAGDSFSVFTDPNQTWSGATDGNHDLLTGNADGAATLAYAPDLLGIGATPVGTLVADIDGVYRVIGAGAKTFTAWQTGEIFFHYADIN